MNKSAYTYILASRKNGTLYVGVTSNIIYRIYEHKNGLIDGFTKKYDVKLLVYFEVFDDITEAIKREKVIKGWTRKKKIDLIESINKDWKDLYDYLL
ncbi:MAG: GIY-YIG nuclease family protein [Alphaproteobacteria bacterium]